MSKLFRFFSDKVNWIFSLFLLIYLFSMFIYPLCINFSFSYLMDTWFKWQSFNVGVLALASSVVFYLGVKKREDTHRKSHYLANAPIITHEFVLINNYLRESIKWLNEQWDFIESDVEQDVPNIVKPKIMESYLGNFRNCMLYANNEERDYLYSLLSKMQMLKSRIDEIESNIAEAKINKAKPKVIACLYNSVEVYSHILTNINHFRQLKVFNSNVFDIEVFKQAIRELNVQSDKYQYKLYNFECLIDKYANKGKSELLSTD